ncbi:hypothetical protein EPO44_15030 [bacterium]|nr:MAG: hypothetical protein EPO44_15030 [bacterium]
MALNALVRKLRLKDAQEAESGYEVLQWLYSFNVRPNLRGIENMQRLLAVTNPKVMGIKAEEVIDEAPVQRLEKTSFYRELVARQKR